VHNLGTGPPSSSSIPDLSSRLKNREWLLEVMIVYNTQHSSDRTRRASVLSVVTAQQRLTGMKGGEKLNIKLELLPGLNYHEKRPSQRGTFWGLNVTQAIEKEHREPGDRFEEDWRGWLCQGKRDEERIDFHLSQRVGIVPLPFLK